MILNSKLFLDMYVYLNKDTLMKCRNIYYMYATGKVFICKSSMIYTKI